MSDKRQLSESERLQYTEAANRQMLEFDSRLLWFSGGGLVAVVSFVSTLESRPASGAVVALAVGTLLLLGSTGATLYSFQRSAMDIARFLDNPVSRFREQQMLRMKRLNLTSLWLGLCGLGSLAVFVVLVMSAP